jgi:hypothetical protein
MSSHGVFSRIVEEGRQHYIINIVNEEDHDRREKGMATLTSEERKSAQSLYDTLYGQPITWFRAKWFEGK